jgi:NADH dehydrogenase
MLSQLSRVSLASSVHQGERTEDKAEEDRVTILIVGATGLLGRATALTLLEEGQRVRVLVREPARQPQVAAELQRAGAELMAGDLTDPASLERACKGALRVFACAHSFLGRGDLRSAQVDHVGHSSLIAAALSAGVHRFVYASALSAREDHPIDFFRTKFEIEQAVRESAIPYTILRPASFMEQHVHEFLGKLILDKGFAVIFGPGRKRRNFVSVRDVAPFAAMALRGDELLNRTLDIGGPDNVSNRDLAAMYLLRSKQGRVFHAPPGLARFGAQLVRPLHEGIARVLEVAAVPDADWPETFDPGPLLAEFPRKMTTVEQFVEERIRDWRRSRVGRGR